MNFIKHLQDTISDKVLSDTHDLVGDDTTKREALSGFFSIFGLRLSDPNALARLSELNLEQNSDSNHILNTIFQDENGESQLAKLRDNIAQTSHLPIDTVSALTATATPLMLTEITNVAGTGGIAKFLQDNVQELVAHLPSWAEAFLPVGLLSGLAEAGLSASALSATTTPSTTSVTGTTPKTTQNTNTNTTPTAKHVNDQVKPINTESKPSGFAKTLLPIIGLVVCSGVAWLMLRGCQENPTPVAKPAQEAVISTSSTDSFATDTSSADNATADTPIDFTPATFSLATDETGEAIYSCRAKAGNDSAFASIKNTLSNLFGTDDCQLNTESNTANTLSVNDQLEGILKLIKGTPNASVNIDGKTIRFNAGNADDIAKLIDGTKALLPADFVVEAEPQLDVATTVANSIANAKNAIYGLNETSTAEDFVKALNLQIINFATASNNIPDDNKEILDLAAEKLTQFSDIKLKIIGHTDSAGNYEANKVLSQKRAQAVYDYLTSKGVAGERLEVLGVSSDHPIATNATEQGRFQNRRIEFAIADK